MIYHSHCLSLNCCHHLCSVSCPLRSCPDPEAAGVASLPYLEDARQGTLKLSSEALCSRASSSSEAYWAWQVAAKECTWLNQEAATAEAWTMRVLIRSSTAAWEPIQVDHWTMYWFLLLSCVIFWLCQPAFSSLSFSLSRCTSSHKSRVLCTSWEATGQVRTQRHRCCSSWCTLWLCRWCLFATQEWVIQCFTWELSSLQWTSTCHWSMTAKSTRSKSEPSSWFSNCLCCCPSRDPCDPWSCSAPAPS